MPEATLNPAVDFSVLNCVLPVLYKPAPLSEMMLALEILDGPYKGVTFAYTHFEAAQGPREEGALIPVRYETRIIKRPKGFTADEAFDKFTSELLLAWLTYATQTKDSYRDLATAKTKGIH